METIGGQGDHEISSETLFEINFLDDNVDGLVANPLLMIKTKNKY